MMGSLLASTIQALPAAVLATVLATGTAHAHKPSDSYLTLRAAGQQIDGQWDIALRDLDYALGLDSDGDGQLTWDEVRERHPQIAAYALSRLSLATGGAASAPCTIAAGAQLIDNHTDGAYSVLRFRAHCPAVPEALRIGYRLFADTDPQHKGLLRLEHAAGGSPHSSSAIFGSDQPEQVLQLAQSSRLAQFSAYLKHGVWHIWIGYDHILFLLSLLLPSVLVWRDRAWREAPDFRVAAIDVLKTVSAFTLAHSITLSLAALGVVALPSQLVESVIAASVVAAALNNLRPFVHTRRWVGAFAFGLIHGFGFAGVLGDLGLPEGSLLLALLGFNAGVELGQLAIVAAFLPLAFLLRATWFYRRVVVMGGSTMIIVAASMWFGERAFAAEPPLVVAVVGHYDNAVGTSDASSQGRITSSLIASRPALRTGELLEFVPGMIVTQHSGDGKANQYFLRGFNLDHGTDFATYIDGMPVNMRSHAHGQGYADMNFLIPELVQRIDYRKGPYFAEDGDFSSAGAARIRLADELPPVASATMGGNGFMRAVVAGSAGMTAAGGRLLYALEANHNDGPWDTPERVRKYSAVLRYSDGAADKGYSVTAMAYRNRWNATDQVPLRAVASGQLGRYGTLDASDGGDSTRYSLSYQLHRRSTNTRSELSAYAIHSRLDLYSNFTYLLADPEQGDQFKQSERRNLAGFDASHTWLHAVNGIEMRSRIGAQGRYDRLSPVGLYTTRARQRTGTIREDRVAESSAALYAEHVAQWLPRFRSVAGMRYDAYRFSVAGATADAGSGGKASAGIVSPKLSLIFGPWARTEYFLNFGKGFHSNDARGVTQTRLADGTPSQPATPLAATRGYEAGVRSELLPGLQSSLALWRLDLDSELVFVGDAGETEASRASRRSGIEWNNHYVARPWLLFDLDLAVSRARYRDDDPAGKHIPGALEKAASFGVTVTDLQRWSGALQLRYFGARPLVEDNSVRSAATTLAYARLGYRISGKTSLALDVFNLFDKRASDIDYFYASRLPGEAAEGVADRHFHPVEPRAVRLTLTHKF
ncbi:TonB-dependent receptor domain-containing protein [Massilia sp. Root418]|jgi:outer membrane cobalamin receptor|uniref:TonB-dependent receptor domain-containing protein n=1 Tax=Massilia sp. Root418 TaxID=1736532 RepID=UPI0009E9B6DA|nr:TonB-dependent receptor [Massilia sp. Root418]